METQQMEMGAPHCVCQSLGTNEAQQERPEPQFEATAQLKGKLGLLEYTNSLIIGANNEMMGMQTIQTVEATLEQQVQDFYEQDNPLHVLMYAEVEESETQNNEMMETQLVEMDEVALVKQKLGILAQQQNQTLALYQQSVGME